MREVIAYVAGVATLLLVGSLCQPQTSAYFPAACEEDPEGRYQIGVYDPGRGEVEPIYEVLAGAPHCIPSILRSVGENLRSRCLYGEDPTEWVPPVYGPVDECPADGG